MSDKGENDFSLIFEHTMRKMDRYYPPAPVQEPAATFSQKSAEKAAA